MAFGINRREIEVFIVGVLGFGLTIFFLPYIENFISGFISYAYVPKLLSYVAGYILLVYIWPRILWKIYAKIM